MSTTLSGDSTTVTGTKSSNISAATNATPIVLTTSTAHGLATGDRVVVASVTGNTAANGTWAATVINSTSLSLQGSIGNGAYVSGGTVVGRVLGPDTTIPSDGDVIDAASVNVAFEDSVDKLQFLARQLDLVHLDTTVFTASGSWTAPFTGYVSIEIAGGGGQGGTSVVNSTVVDTFYPGGGGGAAGAFVVKLVPVTKGVVYDIVIGAGGVAGDGSATTVTIHGGAEVARANGGQGGGGFGLIGTTTTTVRCFDPGGQCGSAGSRKSNQQTATSIDYPAFVPGAGAGGYGSTTNNAGGSAPGNYSIQGYAGGAAGAMGADVATRRGGGGGGGGGGGPYGVGAAGGAGGAANGAGNGTNGTAGSSAAANTGAGGGGGGCGGTGSTGTATPGTGGTGGSGKCTISYVAGPA